MKKISKNKAFSLAEILIVLTFIGFIIIAELVIMQTKVNQYGQPYYTAYHALKKAAYNILADIYCPGEFCPEEGVANARPFPVNNPEALCKRLTEFINTSQNSCEGLRAIRDNAEINPNNPHFIATNSFRFYIGQYHQSEATDSRGNQVGYYVVYVDLNGQKNPNRITCEEGNKLLPDIVPFALTVRGEVIPMGYPIYSKTYMTAKVALPVTSERAEDGTISISNETSQSMSYYEAAYVAWPNTAGAEGETGTLMQNIDYPFSVDYARENIYNDSNINICKNTRGFQYDTNDAVARRATLIGDENPRAIECRGGTFNCRVIIDSSLGTRF